MENLVNLIKNEKYDEALSCIDSIEKNTSPLTVELLLLKGRCILLSDSSEYSLEDAKNIFLKIVEGDPFNTSALLELGWHYLNVEDDSDKALSYFNNAIKVSKDQLIEALKGSVRCIIESESKESAKKFINQNIKFDEEELYAELG